MHSVVLADSGSEGYLLVGHTVFERCKKWIVKIGRASESDFVPVESSNIMYKFGKGHSNVAYSMRMPIVDFSSEIGAMTSCVVDVIHVSTLPFIAGYEFLAEHNICIFPHLRKTFRCSHTSSKHGTGRL